MEEEIKHVCNVCSCEFTDDEGGIDGYFGILPVHFCPTCFSSMCDMASQYLLPEDLQQLDAEQQESFEALKGVRHIVINNCHGGFGLSWDAQIAYLDRAGIAYTLIDRESRDDTVRFGQEIKLANGDDWYANVDIKRDDPILVSVVRELGPDANSNFANLKIVKIPGDVEWEISEYDGLEWVAEKHRIWR
jgi:hypothetical protein